MLSNYNPKQYIAHPNELLIEHLDFVGTENKNIGKQFSLGDNNLGDVFYLIGVLHDFGKYTKIFQYYIYGHKSNDVEVHELIKNYKEHAIFGAFFYYYLIITNIQYLMNMGFSEDNMCLILLGGFYAIGKHHGDIDNIEDIENIERIRSKTSIIQKQLMFIDKNIVESDLSKLLSKIDTSLKIYFDDFNEGINNINFSKGFKGLMSQFIKKLNTNKDRHLIKLFYSSLIYADKYKTIYREDIIKKQKVKTDLIEEFRQINKFDETSDDINKFRNTIYNDIKKKLLDIDLSNHIYTLNAPTGSGKTYNLFNIALTIKDKLSKTGINAKIVYGLPFTSIIDQVYQEAENILIQNGYDKKQIHNILSKHHHLAGTKLTNVDKDGADKNYEKDVFRINSWDNEIIITTFFQIFHTMFGNRNKRLIKYPNFHNTIFILDEIQSTPHKYWGNFKDMFKSLCKDFNSYFVLSSATLPMIFDKSEAVELLPTNKTYFDMLDRTNIDTSFLKNKMGISEIFDISKGLLKQSPTKDAMFVLNTIKSSTQLYKLIKEEFSEKDQLVYLSTNIIPKHRKQRIEQIKTRNCGQRTILVSTQLIEAGVDIDMDIGFRDFGPVDSIVQVLGRINRNGRKDRGVLYLVSLIDEDKETAKEFATYIYDVLSMDISRGLFEGKSLIFEKDYKELFEEYFRLVDRNRGKDVEKSLLEAWDTLRFKDLSDGFRLIEQTYQTVDIFVNIDNEASAVLGEYRKIGKIDDKWERRKIWNMIKKDFAQYVISVDAEKVKNCGFCPKQLEVGLVILDGELFDEYYDTEIGFNVLSRGDDLLGDGFI